MIEVLRQVDERAALAIITPHVGSPMQKTTAIVVENSDAILVVCYAVALGLRTQEANGIKRNCANSG